MHWQVMWVVWALMHAEVLCNNEQFDIDEDFDDSYDNEEITITTPLTTLSPKNYSRRRRNNKIDRNATIDEYDETDADSIAPRPTENPPTTLPISEILATLNIPPVRTSSQMLTPQRTSAQIITASSNTPNTIRYKSNPLNTEELTTETAIVTTTDLEPTSTITYSNSNDGIGGNIIGNTTINYATKFGDMRTTLRDTAWKIGDLIDKSEGIITDAMATADELEAGRQGRIITTLPQIRRFAVPELVKLLTNLTADLNLTKSFNESLQRYNIPTCPPIQTTVDITTEDPFANAAVVSKCFVCGLKAPQIPYDSRCADAFSGDFIPLVPVDSKARSSISRYRKYCRYLDVPGFMEHPFEPRSVFGRFTGGCSVRWVDLTGVYTQRTCRNSRRPVTGKHFASKRMAKLELALTGIENGCLISPMATLLPVSRSISLYARFHACVCTGEWCNRSIRREHWMTNFKLVSMFTLLMVLS